jgi:hypothetical protein
MTRPGQPLRTRVWWLQRWIGRVQARSQRSLSLVGHPFGLSRARGSGKLF